MKKDRLIAIVLLSVVLINGLIPVLAASTLQASDFQLVSWSKIVEYFDYSRSLASRIGLIGPASNQHAYVYMNLLRTGGLRIVYAGLNNITLGENKYLTIPVQTVIMHFKTANKSREVLTTSNFLMLMAFNDTSTSLFPDSPDMNDILWSSFSRGFNYSQRFPNIAFPSQNTPVDIFPLTNSSGGTKWSWGMRYNDLAATWWRTWISPSNHTYQSRPLALVKYDELTYNYTLTISPDKRSATLSENHVIGRIQDLWHFNWDIPDNPRFNHYNSTGCYRFNNKLSNETVYDFIKNNQIKMSMVNFQTTAVFDRTTYSTTPDRQNVQDNEKIVSNSTITTYTDEGEKIFSTSFGPKETYKLFNFTKDKTEKIFDTYKSTTRTAKILGFAQNIDLFTFQIGFMKFVPWLLYDINPLLYQKTKDTVSNMTRASYFFVTAYPKYSGYRIEHDPTYIVYISPEVIPEFPANSVLPIFIAMTSIAVFYARKIKSNKKLVSQH